MAYHKYPRTPHLPWSPGATSDDVFLVDTGNFMGKKVVVTEKLDGENTTLYRDYMHARSISSRPHPSRDWVKALHARIAYHIPAGWRLCGENLYARHAIAYEALEGYFYLFSIWGKDNNCLGWSETREWAELLEIPTPPVLFQGIWHEQKIRALKFDAQTCEGYVVRTVEGFAYSEFAQRVAKWVRQDHVQTDEHWMNQPVVPNRLKSD